MKSLQAEKHFLSNTTEQLRVLNQNPEIPLFSDELKKLDTFPLKPTKIDIFQINLGKMCNQVCKHCHVDAGPDRKEIMTKETLQQCLAVLAKTDISTVDLTGGAPEMNPNFRWFVEELSKIGKKVMVRCNLTIILANKKYHDLPDFFKKHQVEVVSSLPAVTALRTDAQRGKGVFGQSIEALQLLNKVGYGKEGSELILNLVYNPSGAFLPSGQVELEKEFKQRLKARFDVDFNQLFAITNIPISRFLDYLLESHNYDEYMSSLVNAFNPMAVKGVMCRNTISIGWDGFVYDCDFNQMLDLKIAHIKEFDVEKLTERSIIVNQHCYGCTAGAGSSCGGETI